MSDLIERQAAINAAYRADYTGLAVEDVKKVTDEVVKELKQLPSAQPEIIRCKDCRFNTYSKKCLNPDSFFLVPADDFYCGYAERLEDE